MARKILRVFSVLTAGAGIAGIFLNIPWLIIVGAAAGFLLGLAAGCNFISDIGFPLLGAVIGMFISHFAFHMGWGMGLAAGACWFMTVWSILCFFGYSDNG